MHNLRLVYIWLPILKLYNKLKLKQQRKTFSLIIYSLWFIKRYKTKSLGMQ